MITAFDGCERQLAIETSGSVFSESTTSESRTEPCHKPYSQPVEPLDPPGNQVLG